MNPKYLRIDVAEGMVVFLRDGMNSELTVKEVASRLGWGTRRVDRYREMLAKGHPAVDYAKDVLGIP